MIHRLEQAGQAHRDWRRVATEAQAIRRQIALEQAGRQWHLAPLRR